MLLYQVVCSYSINIINSFFVQLQDKLTRNPTVLKRNMIKKFKGVQIIEYIMTLYIVLIII